MQNAIVGGGIGKPTAALALPRVGHEASVYEQTKTLGELGAGLQLAANRSRILIDLSLSNLLDHLICDAAWSEVRIWCSGATRKMFDLCTDSRDRFGATYWLAHGHDHHRVSREAVPNERPDAIHADKHSVDKSQTDHGVTVQFAHRAHAEAEILIAAVGVQSATREGLFNKPKAHFSGLTAWRIPIHMEQFPENLRLPVDANWVDPYGHVLTHPLCTECILYIVVVPDDEKWGGRSLSTRGPKLIARPAFPAASSTSTS